MFLSESASLSSPLHSLPRCIVGVMRVRDFSTATEVQNELIVGSDADFWSTREDHGENHGEWWLWYGFYMVFMMVNNLP